MHVALAVIGAVFLAFAVYLSWSESLDDAAISLAYAKNLVHGHGLVLTRGAEPVEGYSNFLWVLVMAPVVAMRLNAMVVAKVLGLALSLGTLLVLGRIPGVVAHRRMAWLDLLAPALTAISLPFALWAASGMENALESFLIVLAVLLSFRELDDAGKPPWSAIAFFALAITRPEGVVFWFAAIGQRMFLAAIGRRDYRRDAVWFGACAVPLLIYHAWHYSYFGHFVPNTYYAKASDRSLNGFLGYVTDPEDPGVVYLKSFLTAYWIAALAPFAVLAIYGRQGLFRYSLAVGMLAAGLAAVIFNGGDWMPYFRFLSPLVPLFFLAVQEGVRTTPDLLTRIGSRARAATVPLLLVTGLALVGLSVFVNIPKASKAHSQPFFAPYTLIRDFGYYIEDGARGLGIERPSLLTPDVGGTAFNTDLSIIDLAGLADKYIARHPSGVDLADYVFEERRPDFILVQGPWAIRTGLTLDPRLEQNYLLWPLGTAGYDPAVGGLFIRSDLVLARAPCPDAVPWDRATSVVGQRTEVRGPVVSVRPGREGVLLLDIGERDKFLVVLQPAAQPGVLEAFTGTLVGKTVCTNGLVQSLIGIPYIVSDISGSVAVDRHGGS